MSPAVAAPRKRVGAIVIATTTEGKALLTKVFSWMPAKITPRKAPATAVAALQHG